MKLAPVPDAALCAKPDRRVLTMTVTQTSSYDIRHVERYVFDPQEDALANLIEGRPVFFVVDETIWRSHGAAIGRYAAERLGRCSVMTTSGQETDKTLRAVEAICSRAVREKLPRDVVFVAVGGGVVMDIAGFAASMYRRGVKYVRVPTTLIGLIDVSIGIKQGVNFEGKNRLGAFYSAIGSINDSRFLQTLPRNQLSCGLSEIVKVALALDAGLFETLEIHGASLIDSAFTEPLGVAEGVIFTAERVMFEELERNLFEVQLHRIVDFGHTFGPTLETESDYAVHHGEAVALDMLVSTALAVGRRMCSPTVLYRLIALYRDVELPLAHPLLTTSLLMRSMDDARANRAGALNLVVPIGIGSATFVQQVAAAELDAALAHLAHLVQSPPIRFR